MDEAHEPAERRERLHRADGGGLTAGYPNRRSQVRILSGALPKSLYPQGYRRGRARSVSSSEPVGTTFAHRQRRVAPGRVRGRIDPRPGESRIRHTRREAQMRGGIRSMLSATVGASPAQTPKDQASRLRSAGCASNAARRGRAGTARRSRPHWARAGSAAARPIRRGGAIDRSRRRIGRAAATVH